MLVDYNRILNLVLFPFFIQYMTVKELLNSVDVFQTFKHSRQVRQRQLVERIWKIDPDDVKIKIAKQSPMGSTKTVVSQHSRDPDLMINWFVNISTFKIITYSPGAHCLTPRRALEPLSLLVNIVLHASLD